MTFVATDPGNNTDDCTFNVTVSGVAPDITCPANVTVSNDADQCAAVVNYDAATETTGIPASTIAYSQNAGTSFPVGITQVTATATNVVGSDECTFTITVTDDADPVIACPADVTVVATSTAGAVAIFADATATDNCSATVAQTAGPASGATFPIGVTTVTFVATDPSNNTDDCTFNVTVEAVCDEVSFPAGFTFVSFDVELDDARISNYMSGGNASQFFYIQQRQPNGGVLYYVPAFPQFSTDFEVVPGEALLVRSFQPGTFEVCGAPIDPDFRPAINFGYNWVGYMPQPSTTPSDYFDNINNFFFARLIEANQSTYYVPTFPQFNLLQTVENGRGYEVFASGVTSESDWLHGGTTSSDKSGLENGLAKSANNASGVYHAVFGAASQLAGGSTIKVVDADGMNWGELLVNDEGLVMITPLYGRDTLTNVLHERLIGTELFFEHEGVRATESIVFTGDRGLTYMDFDFAEPTILTDDTELEISATIYPNPFQQELRIDFTTPGNGPVSVQLTDVTGRLLREVKTDAFPATGGTGSMRIPTGELPAGMYLMHLRQNDRTLLVEKVQKY